MTVSFTTILGRASARLVTLCAMLATVTALKAETFNVRDYGAVGDDKTDNTAAFSKCLAAVVQAGGGKMLIPDGIYQGRITIPPLGGPSWMTIEICGESAPTPIFGTIGLFPLSNHGAIVKSLDTTGEAVLSARSGSLYSGFSGVHEVIRNLEVRTYDNPRIGGIDLRHAVQCRLENVVISTGVYNVQASRPVHGAKGLVTPANNNGALTLLRNLTVTGYHTGIVAHEHTHGDHIVLGSNMHGLEFATAHHASRFDRVSAMRNTHHVTVTGRHGFSIAQLNIENPGPRQTDAHNEWQNVASDLNDPDNLGIGDIQWWAVRGNVGAVDEFKVNGGTGIRSRRMGAAP